MIFTAIYDSGSSAPNLQSLGFGTAASECTLTDQRQSFPRGVPIRWVVTFSPSLPVGGTATFKISKDGAELVDLHETYTAEETTSCIYATLPSLDVGQYRVEVGVNPSTMPPITGEFDVTP